MRKVLSTNDRLNLLANQNNRCFYCGALCPSQLDHVYAVSLGGQNKYSNYAMACGRCNLLKSNSDIETFREKLAYELGKKHFLFYWEIKEIKTLVGKSHSPLIAHLKPISSSSKRYVARTELELIRKLAFSKLTDLKGSEKSILLMLSLHGNKTGGGISISISELASKCSVSMQTVRNAISTLRQNNYIVIEKKGGFKDGKNKSNEYSININNI